MAVPESGQPWPQQEDEEVGIWTSRLLADPLTLGTSFRYCPKVGGAREGGLEPPVPQERQSAEARDPAPTHISGHPGEASGSKQARSLQKASRSPRLIVITMPQEAPGPTQQESSTVKYLASPPLEELYFDLFSI